MKTTKHPFHNVYTYVAFLRLPSFQENNQAILTDVTSATEDWCGKAALVAAAYVSDDLKTPLEFVHMNLEVKCVAPAVALDVAVYVDGGAPEDSFTEMEFEQRNPLGV